MLLINPSKLWIDIGKEITLRPSEEGKTLLWRTCCLNSLKSTMSVEGFKTGKLQLSFHNFVLTRDIGNMTVTPTGKNPLKKAIITYVQLYSPLKEKIVINHSSMFNKERY